MLAQNPNAIGSVVPPFGAGAGGGGGGDATCTTVSFTNGDLAAGVFTFNHALNFQFSIIQVYDNNNQVVTPDDITMTDANNAAIDLSSFGTLVGTWNATAIGCTP